MKALSVEDFWEYVTGLHYCSIVYSLYWEKVIKKDNAFRLVRRNPREKLRDESRQLLIYVINMWSPFTYANWTSSNNHLNINTYQNSNRKEITLVIISFNNIHLFFFVFFYFIDFVWEKIWMLAVILFCTIISVKS